MTATTNPLPKVVHGIRRRSRLDVNEPAELSIRAAHIAVDGLGADPLLTGALIKLQQAADMVSDWLEGASASATAALSLPDSVRQEISLLMLIAEYGKAKYQEALRGFPMPEDEALFGQLKTAAEAANQPYTNALKAIRSHWREFGPAHGFDEILEQSCRRLIDEEHP